MIAYTYFNMVLWVGYLPATVFFTNFCDYSDKLCTSLSTLTKTINRINWDESLCFEINVSYSSRLAVLCFQQTSKILMLEIFNVHSLPELALQEFGTTVYNFR